MILTFHTILLTQASAVIWSETLQKSPRPDLVLAGQSSAVLLPALVGRVTRSLWLRGSDFSEYKEDDCNLTCYLTVLSASLGRHDFAWRFMLKENILFWLSISYQKPFVCLFLNIDPEIKFLAENCSGLCNFWSKKSCFFYLRFFSRLILIIFILYQYSEISENLNDWNLLKTCLQFTHTVDFCTICIHFYCGEKSKYSYLKKITTDE